MLADSVLLLGGMLFFAAFFPLLLAAVLVPVLYSFWIPQIMRNAKRGSRRGLQAKYIVGTTACRLFLPLCELAWLPFWPSDTIHVQCAEELTTRAHSHRHLCVPIERVIHRPVGLHMGFDPLASIPSCPFASPRRLRPNFPPATRLGIQYTSVGLAPSATSSSRIARGRPGIGRSDFG